MKVSLFCIQRPVFATVINLIIVLAGIIAFRALTVREFPNIPTPTVNIETIYPGASSEIIEKEVTRPLEDSLSTIEGIDFISSISKDESSAITLHFKSNRNIDNATNDIRDSINRAKSFLPDDSKEPNISKVEANADAIIWIAFSSNQHSLMQMSEYADHYVKDKLEVMPGVASVIVAGERKPAMRIWIDPLKLSAYRLTIQDVANALKHQNIAMPSGRLESKSLEFTVFTKTDLETVEDFENIILSDKDSYLLKLSDVAKIELGPRDERFIARYNSSNAIALGIVKQSTANPLDISKALKKIMPDLQADLPQGMEMAIAYDSTIVIKDSINAVYKSIAEAIVLVVLIIFLFLRSWRATIIPIVTIPIALIGGFVLMMMWGFSINILTLLAMVLAIGLVVDDAIVVLENIYRHIEDGMSPMSAAKQGISEIGSAVIAMTLTLVSVFAPVAFAEGKIGKLFTEFAVVLAGTVVISGFTALTLTPMMCSRLLKHEKAHGRFYLYIEQVLNNTSRWYKSGLEKALNHRNKVLIGFVAIILLNLLCFAGLKSEMAPQEDRGFVITIGMAPQGSNLDYTLHYGLQMESILNKTPDIDRHFFIVGWPNVQQAITFSMLKDRGERQPQTKIVDGLNQQLFMNPGLMAFAINPPSSLEQDVLSGQINVVMLYAGKLTELEEITNKVMEKVRANPMMQNMDTDLKMNKPQVDLTVNRDKAAQSGVDIDTIGQSLQIIFGGQNITRFTYGAKQYDVMVQAEKTLRSSPKDLSLILVRSKDGQMLPLSNFIDAQVTTHPNELNHFNKLTAVTLTGSVSPGYSLGQALNELEKIIKDVAGNKVQTDYKGASRAFMQSSTALYLTFALALVVVFLVLAAQFESFLNPFIIMLSVPMGILGALLTLNLTGGSLNIFSQIGLITLVGLITKHGILIVEFTNQLRNIGRDIDSAIMEAATLRLRPILMTTAATILGAIPLALATGAGAESRQEIGWTIVGGMLIGTFLTLYVVPVMLRLFARK